MVLGFDFGTVGQQAPQQRGDTWKMKWKMNLFPAPSRYASAPRS